jgi:hypothetical protein
LLSVHTLVSLVSRRSLAAGTANLRTEIPDFRGIPLKQDLSFTGRTSHACRELPGKVESTDLGRGDLRREIGHPPGILKATRKTGLR